MAPKKDRKQKNVIEETYEKYYKDVYRFVLALSKDPHVAEDVTQDTFVKAIKAVDRFNGDCDIKVWLCQIAKNSYFTYAGKQKRELVDADEVIAESDTQTGLMENDGYDFISDTVDKEQAIKIHRILHDLQEPYKEVFTLRVFGELRFGQIADIFGKTESWARVTYHRARMMIMETLQQEVE